MSASLTPIDAFMAELRPADIPRTADTAVFLTRTLTGMPPAVARQVRHDDALQRSKAWRSPGGFDRPDVTVYVANEVGWSSRMAPACRFRDPQAAVPF